MHSFVSGSLGALFCVQRRGRVAVSVCEGAFWGLLWRRGEECVQAYLDDSLYERQWVEEASCARLVLSIQNAFNTNMIDERAFFSVFFVFLLQPTSHYTEGGDKIANEELSEQRPRWIFSRKKCTKMNVYL